MKGMKEMRSCMEGTGGRWERKEEMQEDIVSAYGRGKMDVYDE
jgi:hypothetical protein